MGEQAGIGNQWCGSPGTRWGESGALWSTRVMWGLSEEYRPLLAVQVGEQVFGSKCSVRWELGTSRDRSPLYAQRF